MRINSIKAILKTAMSGAAVLLLGAGIAAAQSVSLTAGPTTATLPDGSAVPMWGYTCTAAASATCVAANPNAGTGWSPVIITVPVTSISATGSLTINLTNNLSFATGSGTNTVPTSLMIVGQLGGGLGIVGQRTTTTSPSHAVQGTTWSTVGTGPTFTPPTQGARVQSFGTEVAAGATTALTWNNLQPGTYLLESGTHPSIQATMGLIGMLVVTQVPSTTAGVAYPAAGTSPAVSYNAEVPLIFSEIDPVQNNSVNAAVTTAGFTETAVWNGQPGGCGNQTSPTYHTCYPPVVNYTPLYFLINGAAFNKTNTASSLFAATSGTAATPVTGTVLVRMVNAGSRMHVPAVVGSQTSYQGSAIAAPTAPAGGFSLIAEDGNPLPGAPRVQSEVFMAAGKTYDVMIDVPTSTTALGVYDRELSLGANKIGRDAGMLGYISVNSAGVPASPALGAAVARADIYNSIVAGQTLTVSDQGKGLIANDTNVYGVHVIGTVAGLNLNPDGTFTYTGPPTSFTYCANGTVTGSTCSSGVTATVTLGAATVEGASGISMNPSSFTSKVSSYLKVPAPGPLAVDVDTLGYPLTVATATVAPVSGIAINMDPNGGFSATPSAPCTTPAGCQYTFTYNAQNSQGTQSGTAATVTLNFPAGSGLTVNVKDPNSGAVIKDFRWIIEEDKSFYIDPTKTTNLGSSSPIVPILGVNFHTSDMTFIAQGCTGAVSCESGQTQLGSATVCDVGNGNCRAATLVTYPDGTTGYGKTPSTPGQVYLDPTKRYYISILPGDAANPFISGNVSGACYNTSTAATASNCGHSMSGAPISPGQTAVNVTVQADPYPPGKLSVDVFEDDFPLNGEQDSGGGVDVLAPNEPGLGGFNIVLWDDMGGSGDVTGQMTYDMFNMPLGNSLDGTMDPASGHNACPITKQAAGITGMIVTCPKYEDDGVTLSPLAGQAVVSNLMPGRFSVQAIPGADRIARGEQWLQTNTLDGQKAHDSFIRIGEPNYFQEFGPAGYHVNIGFANPGIINSRLPGICNGTDPNSPLAGAVACNHTVSGKVTTERMSRTPDERLYSSGSRDSFYFTTCYISIGDPDGEDFAFTTCASDGTFSISGLPPGQWRLTTFDQWNDQLVDGLSFPIDLTGMVLCPGTGSTATSCNMGDIPANQWQANVYTRTFIDDSRDGVSQSTEGGIPFVNTTVRYRDGSMANNLVTDLTGTANFNETFPLFNWYVVEADTTRYKTTGIHTVYDAGGPADGTLTTCQLATPKPGASVPLNGAGYPNCGKSAIGANLANTYDPNPLPANLSIPGAVYCTDADCTGQSINSGPVPSATTNHSTGRIDPPWVLAEAWQGYSGQNSFIEFGKAPYAPGENGGIKGHVVYASTRPFDDPMMLVQTQWEPLVPHVTINLYKEGFAADGITPTLTLVDRTQTSSWDDWAQGFRSDGIPNMNCPGQSTSDLFYFSIYNQPQYLDLYNQEHATPGVLNTSATPTALPYNSQYKCYDGMHNWNQLQASTYDGVYAFPSVNGRNPATGNTTGTNCTICTKDTDPLDAFRYGKEDMLPAGKYVVEVVPPQGYEIVKEEDKNILIGDNFIAPVTQEFGSLSSIFIVPDQASVASSQQYPGAGYNQNNAQNATNSLGTSPNNGIVPGFTPEPTWPCVGEARIVPDYISLFPQSKQVAPFAGATRNMCDRKEVTLNDQAGAIAKFYIYTSTHKAAKFTGVITDDFTSEFDPFSPQFGEKFAPANLPIGIKDWTGTEISRVYADWWGDYDGLTFSTWEVNPPNPTGYSPTMMIFCMNDKGPILDTRAGSPTNGTMITDPLYNSDYSQFCYELPYMPGQTDYLDTPVVPTSAFSAGYNHPDCNYPTLTPAVSEVDGDGVGPWIAATGSSHPITITALGDQLVPNYGYVGPSATAPPFNQKTITRHYGFGASAGKVTIGGVTATVTGWSDTSITAYLPTTSAVPSCLIQQQAIYGGSAAKCGQLVITTSTGLQSVDTVTVTIGGKAPTHVTSNAPLSITAAGSIQKAIDAAQPGDLIILDPTCTSAGASVACTTAGATKTPSTHNEMVIMWKPVRLQGVGAASSVIDANAQPAGKLDPWRRQIDCVFGIAMDGTPISTSNPFDSPTDTANAGKPYSCPAAQNFAIDRLPLEAVVGWDATLNGNLAELLQEPSLMGAYEGAGITVLGKGVKFPAGQNPYGSDTFPTGTSLLTPSDCGTRSNPFPSNFQCNPSSIDGIGITDASQGGGGIFIHGWVHYLQIANNRIFSNIGTLSGGINLGQGEFAPGYTQGGGANAAPGSCMGANGKIITPPGITLPTGNVTNNTELPYCENLGVNMHNNSVTQNSSIGDELFSATTAGAGGVSFCTGADYYKFNYNWVCGNMGTGDGGGVGHLGLSYNGDIEHNTIIFNQSLNPTISTNGGGLLIMGTPDVDPTCGTTTDQDCITSPPGYNFANGGGNGTSDGVGPELVINANLIQGNAAEAGSGGGLRFQEVNGTDVVSFPHTNSQWYSPTVTNNIIVNNVAGWDGAGISLQDALAVNLINNTIMSNDTTATAGPLFTTLGAPLAGSPNATNTTANGTTSLPQPAGLVAMPNSPQLLSAISGLTPFTCPANHPNCGSFSSPYLANDLFWQNRAYYVGVGALSATYQQNIVSMYNLGGTAVASQPSADATTPNGNGIIVTGGTGACTPGVGYWDIGIRGDSGPGNHASGFQLAPTYSILTNASENAAGTNNLLATNPTVVSQFCNGSRTPPEFAAGTFNVPPGISDATVPNPIFNLTPAATVDEGNNWVNLTWGPLTLTNPVTGTILGNYAPAANSQAIDYIPLSSAAGAAAPMTDFFGNPRADAAGRIDVGAVEYQGALTVAALGVAPGSLAFGNATVTTTSAVQNLTLQNYGGAGATTIAVAVTAPFARSGGTCGTTLAAGTSCTIGVVYSPTATGASTGTVTITANVAVAGSPVSLTGTGIGAVRTATLTPTSHNYNGVTRNCPGTGIAGILACTLDPAQTFTLTNTGNVPLTGITQGVLGGANASEFSIAHLLSTCGPAGGGQIASNTTLAPGATCTVVVQFKPLTAQTTGVKNATISVTDSATVPTQTSTLTGTAR